MNLKKTAKKNRRKLKNQVSENYKGWIVTGLTALSAMAVRKGSEFIWKKTTRRDPPKNVADHDVDWSDALLWTILTGLAASIVRVIIMRNVSIGVEENT